MIYFLPITDRENCQRGIEKIRAKENRGACSIRNRVSECLKGHRFRTRRS